jgi:hypothetical protein
MEIISLPWLHIILMMKRHCVSSARSCTETSHFSIAVSLPLESIMRALNTEISAFAFISTWGRGFSFYLRTLFNMEHVNRPFVSLSSATNSYNVKYLRSNMNDEYADLDVLSALNVS